jgi:hypothetical protein
MLASHFPISGSTVPGSSSWDDYDLGELENMAGGRGNATLAAAQAELQSLLEGQFL